MGVLPIRSVATSRMPGGELLLEGSPSAPRSCASSAARQPTCGRAGELLLLPERARDGRDGRDEACSARLPGCQPASRAHRRCIIPHSIMLCVPRAWEARSREARANGAMARESCVCVCCFWGLLQRRVLVAI